MEGRTIVRPGLSSACVLFARNRGLQWRAGQLSGQAALDFTHTIRPGGFNGGPDNCPARPLRSVRAMCRRRALQWRAGQLSGQADGVADSVGGISTLQWRAGQLSGQAIEEWAQARYGGLRFNGGPDNCPARRRLGAHHHRHTVRASMEGRTIVRPGRASAGLIAEMASRFNGGPDNCPARLVR